MRLAAILGIVVCVCLGAPAPSSSTGKPAATTGKSYRIQLRPFVVPPLPPSGLVIRARVNGGPPLRLLLDSGTQYVVLSRRAAAKSGCSGGTDLALVGAGAPVAGVARSLRAETVEIDDFVARDVDVLVAGESVAEGIDGVLPLSLFGSYLIRLDIPARSLDLEPYPEEVRRQPGDLAAIQSNDLLFVKCRLDGAREAYFMLDTGSSYNAISDTLSRELNSPELLDGEVSLQGGTVPVRGYLTRAVTRLRVGELELVPGPLVAVDLSLASRYHQMEVSGLIGYPALRGLVLVVNYRDGLIRIAPK